MFLRILCFLICAAVAGEPAQAADDSTRFSAAVTGQIAEAEAKATTESVALYRKRLLKLKTLLQEKEASYLKLGIEESEAEAANGDLALLEAFEWVEVRKLKKPEDCDAALKILRSIEDPQESAPELQNGAHQVMARLIQPLCATALKQKK